MAIYFYLLICYKKNYNIVDRRSYNIENKTTKNKKHITNNVESFFSAEFYLNFPSFFLKIKIQKTFFISLKLYL